MIYTHITYSPKDKDKQLGLAYNNVMKQTKDEDWVCFLDHDAMFTTIDWYRQITNIVEKYPQIGLYTCMTNRINCRYQLANVNRDNHDIKYHRIIGKKLQKEYNTEISDITNQKTKLSGVVILISKKTWNAVGGFIEKDGLLGVDNDIHKRCKDKNIPVGLMKGVYVYHWYRGDGYMDHLK